MARIATVLGGRRSIIEMAAVEKALGALHHEHDLVHVGNPEELAAGRGLAKELGVREPDHVLEMKDQPPHLEIARTMLQAGSFLEKADLVLVSGESDTALAAALLAKKLGKAVGHVGAGLRSFDRSQPDEVNRVLIDHLSDVLFAPTPIAGRNVEAEGIRGGVCVTGGPSLDSVRQFATGITASSRILKRLRLESRRYALLTLHRPENVELEGRLRWALDAVGAFGKKTGFEVVLPIHPRTERNAKRFRLQGLLRREAGLRVIPPAGFSDFLALERDAAVVFTDSGGVQEEACFLRVPCVTLREATERAETLEAGANVLAGREPRRILECGERQLLSKREWPDPYGVEAAGVAVAREIEGFLG